LNTSSFQIGADGSVLYQAFLREGDAYQVVATLPVESEDLGALASSNGELTPLFAAAAADGAFTAEPAPLPGDIARPASIDRFLELPDDLPAALTKVARQKTAGAKTDFEKGWLLQYWFRDSGDFTYSTSVSSGSGSLELENWLTDPTSRNYRIGYCEQFASSMAVLSRVLGIPSRVVWGFTPGEVRVVDGQEVIQVRDKNAHAWVEMWMDGVGWVKFDPTPRNDGALPPSVTAAFDPVSYLPPPAEIDLDSLAAGDLGGPNDPSRFDLIEDPVAGQGSGISSSTWWLALPLIALLAGVVPLLKSLRRRRRLRRLREGDVTAAWEEIVDRLEDLGSPVPAYQTPLEFADATDRVLVPLARSYSAAIYGGINGSASKDDLETVEAWLKHRYEGGRRTRAAFNLKSLID